MKLHLIMPMGGKGSRFSKYGYEFPKPLLEIKGKPFFYWATQSIAKFIEVQDITFVVLKEHVEKYQIDEKIKAYYPGAIIHVIPEVLNGAVLTCMEGVKEIKDDQVTLEEKELKIQQAFAAMMRGRTSFIVAHRLSTIQSADVILVMKDGHVIEQGNHESLLAKGGFYATLYQSQFAQ